MKIIETEILDCYILEPAKFGDERGYFSPYYIEKELKELGFLGVKQANRSMSSKGVVRGLHFQEDPMCQAKIVEVIKGSAIDVVVDIRKDSLTFGKHIAVKLTDDNNRQLYVPRGFAHGFISLEDNTVFQYLVDNDYAPELEGGILWNDPELNIPWNEIFQEYNISKPILSEKDLNHKKLSKTDINFLKKHFKSSGVTMWEYANGIDNSKVVSLEEANKCISVSETFEVDVDNINRLKKTLLQQTEKVTKILRSQNCYASTVAVTIKTYD